LENILQLADRFALPGGGKKTEPFGNGHINKTYLITIDNVKERYILQWINSYVFIRPREVMENMLHITEHLQKRIRMEGGDPDRETIRMIPSVTGEPWVEDEDGEVWRVMLCVPDTISPQHPDDLQILEECGEAFGCFSRRLKDFPASSLYETIVDFHNTPARLQQLENAAAADPCGRLKDVAEEMAFARAREAETRVLVEAYEAGKLPLRVTHNDTKVNNVLLDRETGKAVCVIDLDTVMPGLLAYDFGDAIRVGACSAEEDERDLSKIHLELPKAEAFARGFLRELKGELSEEEVLSLEAGARLMTFECGMRFLADHLNGDKYFRIHRLGQNLDRARAQFALLTDLEKHQEEMKEMLMRLYQ
jgi:hypothetical protein